MRKYTAAILDDNQQWTKACVDALAQEGFNAVTASSVDALLDLAAKHYCQLYILDVAAARRGASGGRPGDLSWIARLGPVEADQGLFWLCGDTIAEPGELSIFGFQGSTEKARGISTITGHIRKICRLVKSLRPQCWEATEGGGLAATVFIEGSVLGISETGLCVESRIFAPSPTMGFDCSLEILESAGLKKPILKLVNSEPSKPASIPASIRSYFQITGWTDKERQQLRAWLTKSRLKPAVL